MAKHRCGVNRARKQNEDHGSLTNFATNLEPTELESVAGLDFNAFCLDPGNARRQKTTPAHVQHWNDVIMYWQKQVAP